jgi:O-antigen/teichoic acid export membrane protein
MKETSKHWQVLFKYFSFYMAFVLIVSVCYQLLIADIVNFFFPESYQDAIPYARWLAIGAMIQGSYFFASALLMFLQRSDRLFFITGTVGSIGLVSGILMYQWLGVFGVVYSYIFVWFLFSAATYFTGFKCVKEYISNA